WRCRQSDHWNVFPCTGQAFGDFLEHAMAFIDDDEISEGKIATDQGLHAGDLYRPTPVSEFVIRLNDADVTDRNALGDKLQDGLVDQLQRRDDEEDAPAAFEFSPCDIGGDNRLAAASRHLSHDMTAIGDFLLELFDEPNLVRAEVRHCDPPSSSARHSTGIMPGA